MLSRWSEIVVRRRRAVLVVMAFVALVAGAASPTLFGKLEGGGFDDPGSDSARAAELLAEEFGVGQPNLVMLVTADGDVDSPDAVADGTALATELAAEDGVTDVRSYWTSGSAPALRSHDGTQALVLASLSGEANGVDETLATLLPDYDGGYESLDVQVGGYAMLQHEMTEQSERDVVLGEMLVFPITLVVLVLVFGSMLAAALPLAVALVTVLFSLGLMWVLASVTSMSVLAANVVTLLGLGLAIDYSLLIVSRFREESAAGLTAPEALRRTMRSAGRTVVFSAITVAIAVSSMLWFPLLALQSIGIAGIATALLAAVASLTVLPALLLIAGPRVLRRRVSRRRAARLGESDEDGMWHRVAVLVMRRPVPVVTLVTMLLLLLGTPFLGVRLGVPDERVMPESSSARQVADTLGAEFDSSEQNALQVVLPEFTGDPAPYAAQVADLPGVARVDVAPGTPAGTLLSVVPDTDDADILDDLVVELRNVPAPSEALVGGIAAVGHDANAALVDRIPVAAGTVAAGMVVLIFLLTGSVLLPFLSIVLSSLSLTAAFGALVWVFQDGNLSGLLGDFTVTGTLATTVPVMLFAIAFGLAMDYQVFLLARIREEYERTGSTTTAVALGLERIGRIVTAAAVLISIVFLGFLVSGVTFVKAFGVGLPLAVLVDATLVRGALLPATIKLAGRAAWWAPGPLRRLHERFGLREDATTDDGKVRVQPESPASTAIRS